MNIKTLRADTRFQLGNITSSEYSDLNLDRQLDKYYKKAIEIALMASGEWEVSGEVATTKEYYQDRKNTFYQLILDF